MQWRRELQASKFWNFWLELFCDGEDDVGCGAVNPIYIRLEVAEDVISGMDEETFREHPGVHL